jgi:anti-sigma B factor antagonist
MDEFKIESVTGTRDDVRILRLSGPFTLQGLFEFQSLVRGLTDPILIIDLTAVPYMDSASLGAVMSLHTSTQRHHRKYGLVGASDRLRTLFNVAGVERILVTFPTLEEALEQLSSKAATN